MNLETERGEERGGRQGGEERIEIRKTDRHLCVVLAAAASSLL